MNQLQHIWRVETDRQIKRVRCPHCHQTRPTYLIESHVKQCKGSR